MYYSYSSIWITDTYLKVTKSPDFNRQLKPEMLERSDVVVFFSSRGSFMIIMLWVSHQARQLLFQTALILLQRLNLLLFALQVDAQLTDLLGTHSIQHTLYTCTSEYCHKLCIRTVASTNHTLKGHMPIYIRS